MKELLLTRPALCVVLASIAAWPFASIYTENATGLIFILSFFYLIGVAAVTVRDSSE